MALNVRSGDWRSRSSLCSLSAALFHRALARARTARLLAVLRVRIVHRPLFTACTIKENFAQCVAEYAVGERESRVPCLSATCAKVQRTRSNRIGKVASLGTKMEKRKMWISLGKRDTRRTDRLLACTLFVNFLKFICKNAGRVLAEIK